MNVTNLITTRIDDRLLNLLDEFASKHHWTASQSIREILTLFFENELSEISG